jgi:antitoxin component YwqK of YwqJK toxin-antitoxin module
MIKRATYSLLLAWALVGVFGLLSQSVSAQQPAGTIREVARKHPNGKPYVVLFVKETNGEIVKEEIYYSNGNLEWEGYYKRKIEDGSWKYYYPNGKLKSDQHYSKGKEHGVFLDYDEKGKLVKQSVYNNGQLMSEQNF